MHFVSQFQLLDQFRHFAFANNWTQWIHYIKTSHTRFLTHVVLFMIFSLVRKLHMFNCISYINFINLKVNISIQHCLLYFEPWIWSLTCQSNGWHFTLLYGTIVKNIFQEVSWYASAVHICEVRSEYSYLRIFTIISCWWFYTNWSVFKILTRS